MGLQRRLSSGIAAALIAGFGLASCAGGPGGPSAVATTSDPLFHPNMHHKGSQHIAHIVVVVQENRSFDNFFSTFPNADGTTGGCMEPPSGIEARPLTGSHGCPKGDTWVPLQEVNLVTPCDFGHSYNNVVIDYDGGQMDGFGRESGGAKCPGKVGALDYQYVNPSQIAPYWTMAQQYVLADHMFQTQGSGSFTAHQDLIAGATYYDPAKTKSIVDFPSKTPWGCDAPAGTVTSQLFWNGTKVIDQYHKGPFPCFTYATLRDLLDAKGVPWKYYTPLESGGGIYWNAFDAIEAVRDGPEWNTNVAPPKEFFTDVSGGTLPAVSWVIPENPNSDHPGTVVDTGPSWVASIVNAVGQSSYWDSTAVIVVWDDWGGLYDHEPPPFFDHWGGLGFRVPMIVISPYAREAFPSTPGYISHTQYEFGSVLKLIEDTFGLGSLKTTDQRANSMGDCFNFKQKPRSFSVISSKYSRSYFLRQPPSNKPVDTE